MDFLEDKIITRFGVPSKIVTNNAKAFCSTEMSSFCFKYGIIYHMHQITILKEMVKRNQVIKI
jgi:hypothetical protein